MSSSSSNNNNDKSTSTDDVQVNYDWNDTEQRYTRTNSPSDNAVVNNEAENIERRTAQWTKNLPEAFGIRDAIQRSPYRWCTREAGLWAIATGTVMSFHRYRMGSKFMTIVNAGFASTMVVWVGSYYYCFKKRDYNEKVIAAMMQLNQFVPAEDMPPQIPYDAENHPFVKSIDPNIYNDDENQNKIKPLTYEYAGNVPERKEWQPPLPPQDVTDVFKPIKPNK